MPNQIKIRKAPGKWVVRAGGAVLGESQNALELSRGELAPEIYFPQGDIAMSFLEASDRCLSHEGVGEARYFSIPTKSTVIEDAAWAYDAPLPGAAALADHVAFHPGKVTVEEL